MKNLRAAMAANRRVVIAGILALVALSVVVALFYQGGGGVAGAGWVRGARNVIGLIYLDGVLTSGAGYSSLTESYTGSDDIVAFLREATQDPAVRAVVLRVNSPGGSAAAAQEISQEIKEFRDAGKVIVTSMGDVGASGAYWIAAQTDRIFAVPATMTGSIGVIMETYDLAGLYGKLGISPETIKSGPFKDIGTSSRPMTPEEQKIMQAMVDDIFDQFVGVVAEGRKMTRAAVLPLADGRVFTGRQAMAAGLVDEMGNLPAAVRKTAELAGIAGSYRVKEYGALSPWQLLLREIGAAARSLGAAAGNLGAAAGSLSGAARGLGVLQTLPISIPGGR